MKKPTIIAKVTVPGTDSTVEIRRTRTDFVVVGGGYRLAYSNEAFARKVANMVWTEIRTGVPIR